MIISDEWGGKKKQTMYWTGQTGFLSLSESKGGKSVVKVERVKNTLLTVVEAEKGSPLWEMCFYGTVDIILWTK